MTPHRYLLVLLPSMLALTAPAVHAQAPPKSGFQMPHSRSERCVSPLIMVADRVIFDTPSARIIAAGNVELYFDNYILTGDQVTYDRATNKLIAEPNAVLTEPNGAITRADRLEAANDLRDAFVAWMREDNVAGGC